MFYLRHFWPLTSYQPGIQFLAIFFTSQSARAPFEIRQTSQDEECFNYFYHGLSCQVDTFTSSCILFSTQARKLQKSEKGSERMWKRQNVTKGAASTQIRHGYSPNLPGSGISWPHLAHQGVWPMKARHQARKRYLTCERKMSRGNHVEPWTCSAWRKQHGDRIKIDRNNQILTRRIYKWNSKHSRSF